jgi:hypothetical protein
VSCPPSYTDMIDLGSRLEAQQWLQAGVRCADIRSILLPGGESVQGKAAKGVACSEYVQNTRLRLQGLAMGFDSGEMVATTTCIARLWRFGDRGMCFTQH